MYAPTWQSDSAIIMHHVIVKTVKRTSCTDAQFIIIIIIKV